MKHMAMAIRFALLAALVVGCGKGGDDSDAGASSSTAQEQAQSARDACSLITAEEVAAAYGAPVEPKPEIKGSRYSSCEFSDPAKADYFVFGIEVYWQGGREGWSILRSGTAAATRVLDSTEEGVDSASILAVGELPNLGDRAVFSDIMGGHVLKDDRLIDFKFGIMPHAREHFRPLAQIVLARL